MDGVAINQTMYESFFNSLGIFIGFLQAAIFQVTLDAKWKDKEKHRPTLIMLLVVQELLLLAFFYSLIYIHYFGTYVIRYPLFTESISSFMKIIRGLNGAFNTLILVCVSAIFLFNLFLFLQELKIKKTKIWIIVFISIIIFIISMGLTYYIKPLIYVEKVNMMGILKTVKPCYCLYF
jgi:hypothetical protein